MKLHDNLNEFNELISLTAREKHLPESAVERDYFIVRALLLLSGSEYGKYCVFKGGTSLSKCYPGSIERFSEDIDLTFIPEEGMTNKQIERRLKAIEKLMTTDADVEQIPEERNDRNKSAYFWKGNRESKIKLEIGSSVRPEPYGIRTLRTYIQDYLTDHGFQDVIEEYDLETVSINVLNIERTFVDKVMAVKRHSICGAISQKARHIYDVVRLLQMNEIKTFMEDKERLKTLIVLTKQTDSAYLEKRNIPIDYDPVGSYDFPVWKEKMMAAKGNYERLHEELLYTDEKQSFDDAIKAFGLINSILADIKE